MDLLSKKIDFSETGKPVIKIAELNNGITGTIKKIYILLKCGMHFFQI